MMRRGRNEGTIYQRPDGTWAGALQIGRTSEGKRKRVWVYGRDKTIVRGKLARLMADRIHGTLVEPSRETVSHFLTHWLETVAKLRVRPATYRQDQTIIKQHLAPRIGGVLLTGLRPEHVQSLLADLARAGKSPHLQRRVIGVLHRALTNAVKLRRIPYNVCDAVTQPRVPRKEMRTLTPEQVGVFLRVAQSDRLYALYVLALTTGLRQGELLGLQWDDLDLDASAIAIRRQLTDNNGPVIAELKTRTSQRRVDLPPVAVVALKAHRKAMLKKGHHQADGLIFVDTQGHPLRKSNLLRRSYFPILKRAGLPVPNKQAGVQGVRFHDLRHTAATLMLQQGIHPKVVQERLGHAQISLTLDTYSHVVPSMQKEAAEKIDAVITTAIASAKVPKPAGPKVVPLRTQPR